MMNNKNVLLRQKVFEYVDKEYNSKIEYLWMRYPNYAVFRNNENKKQHRIYRQRVPFAKPVAAGQSQR